MPETSTADIHMLDSGYSREARSLLYQAYRHEPTFKFLFEAERPGFLHGVCGDIAPEG